MRVEQFPIQFSFRRRQFEVQVQRMQPQKHVMYRVSLETGDKNPEVFVFYEMAKGEELFWFDLNDSQKQAMAKVIADALLAID